MPDGWAEVACQVPAELADQLSEQLIELSGNGVCIENQTVDTFSLENLQELPVLTVRAYFAVGPDLDYKVTAAGALLLSICAGHDRFTPQPPTVKMVNQEDWANSWKKHFHTSPVGRRLLLKPSWEECSCDENRIVIEVDPGMAFGTGTHATTRLCLEALERIFDNTPPFSIPLPLSPPTILDVGTGSGVLAIAARKLGAGMIVAVDIDPEAVVVAQENLAKNGIVDDLEISTTPLSQIDSRFSIVLANILAEDLIRMAAELSSRLLPHGLIVLSGILNEREEGVDKAYTSCGLTLVETTRQQEWGCLVYRRDE